MSGAPELTREEAEAAGTLDHGSAPTADSLPPPTTTGAGPSSTSGAAAAAAALTAAAGDGQEVDRTIHPSGIVPKLQNCVATVNLGCKLDLPRIANEARNVEYNPKRFAAVIMRIRDPKTTALIFASGKLVCTGAKDEHKALTAVKKYVRTIQLLEFPAKCKDFKLQNMVASAAVNFPIRLEGLAFSHGGFCSYEPELFPGLIYKMASPKVVLLIFVSGKIVLTGAKSRADIYKAFEQIYPVLHDFRKTDVSEQVEDDEAPALPGGAEDDDE